MEFDKKLLENLADAIDDYLTIDFLAQKYDEAELKGSIIGHANMNDPSEVAYIRHIFTSDDAIEEMKKAVILEKANVEKNLLMNLNHLLDDIIDGGVNPDNNTYDA